MSENIILVYNMSYLFKVTFENETSLFSIQIPPKIINN